jgi:LysM repeat protein
MEGKRMTLQRTVLLVALTIFCGTAGLAPEVDAKPRPVAQAKKRAAKSNAKSKAKRKKGGSGGSAVTYTVRGGDTILKIAHKFGVKAAQVKRWNRLKGDTVRKGQKLKIHPNKMPRTRHRTWHKVKKGETLTHVAKKYKVDVGDVRAWNPRVDPRKLRMGQKIAIWKMGPKHRSKSSGSANSGRLAGGQMLGDGRGYRVRTGKRAYGTNQTVSTIRSVIEANAKKHPKAGKLMIGDVSFKEGGYMRPHVSHQSGRDADISYYIKGTDTAWRFRVASPRTLNVKATWDLFHGFIETGRVEYIFVDYGLQRVLFEHAKKRGFKEAYLTKVFQYPRGRGSSRGTIRYSRGHDDHFHIRFKCPPANKNCR